MRTPNWVMPFQEKSLRIWNDILVNNDLKILDGKKVVEILTRETGKGLAVKKLFENMSYDFVLSIGDDATDEEMFEYLMNFSNALQ